MTQVIPRCPPDPRTIDPGKTRINRLTKVGHPGWGRTVKSSHYETPEQAERVKRRAAQLGFKTVNDYRNALAAQDCLGHLPEEDQSHGAAHLDVPSVEVAPLSIEIPAGDPPREETPLPKRPWEDFWKEVLAIIGGVTSGAWLWLSEGEMPIVEYGQVIEFGVPSKTFKDHFAEREYADCILRPALEKVGITKTPVIALRPRVEASPKQETPVKKAPPIDPVIATLEEEMRAQRSLDPRGTNEVVKGKLAELLSQIFARRRELKPPRQWQSHIALWRQNSGKRGVSAFESTGPATRGDLREAERVIKKDSS